MIDFGWSGWPTTEICQKPCFHEIPEIQFFDDRRDHFWNQKSDDSGQKHEKKWSKKGAFCLACTPREIVFGTRLEPNPRQNDPTFFSKKPKRCLFWPLNFLKVASVLVFGTLQNDPLFEHLWPLPIYPSLATGRVVANRVNTPPKRGHFWGSQKCQKWPKSDLFGSLFGPSFWTPSKGHSGRFGPKRVSKMT